MNPTNKAARIAGAIYLALVILGPFTLMYVPTKLIVQGNASATSGNILEHETLFRLGIVGELFGAVIFIALGFALYQLLGPVNKVWARAMVGLMLVSAGVGFVNALNDIAALTLFSGADFLTAFSTPQRNALGMLFLRLNSEGNFINEIFWGLWLFPFGLLVFRSGFLPRFIGVWLILNCFAYLVLSMIALLFPPYYEAAFRLLTPVMFGEMVIMLWLLIKGAKPRVDSGFDSPTGEGVAFPGELTASPTIGSLR
jgi:hypothetical protein